MSVIAHEAGKFELLRVSADEVEHLAQDGIALDTTAMQPNIDLDVGAQPGPQTLGQLQILLQARGRVDQPLQLTRGIEGALQLLVEKRRGPNRQRFSHKNVEVGKCLGVDIEEGLMKRHQSFGAGTLGDVANQRVTGQRFLDDAVVLAGAAQRLCDAIKVAIHAVEVDEHAGSHRAIFFELLVQRPEIFIIRRAVVGGAQGKGPCGPQAERPKCAEKEVTSSHALFLSGSFTIPSGRYSK
jgi:hypothetical protein